MSLSQQLETLMRDASFTIADMALWCERDYSAMRTWVRDGVNPHPVHARYLEESMEMLQWAIKNMDLLPIPRNILRDDRAAYVTQVKNVAVRKFPKRSSADERI